MASTATKVVLGIGCGLLLLIGGGLATCAGCFALIGHSARQSASVASPEENPYTMWDLCKESVTKRLRAPSTAEFVGSAYLDIQHHVFHDLGKHKTKNDFLVKGEVDSQNGFGAMLRSEFSCSITWLGYDQYRVNYTRVSDR
jgi:hypothetical protein